MRYADLNKIFGKPDSIMQNDAQCGTNFDAEDYLAFYKNFVFEKNIDTLAFDYLDFTIRSSHFMQFDRIKLTSNTTIEELKKYYPISVKRDTMEVEYYHPIVKRVRIISIDTSPKENENEKWYLIFYQNKLFKIERWHSC